MSTFLFVRSRQFVIPFLVAGILLITFPSAPSYASPILERHTTLYSFSNSFGKLEVSEGPFEDDAMARRLVFVASNGLQLTTLENSNERSFEMTLPDGLIQLSLMRGNILLTLAPNQVGVKPVTLVLDKNGAGGWDIGDLLSDSEVARARAALVGPQTADVLNSFVNALTEEEILLVADDGTWALNPLFAQSKSCSHAIVWAAAAMEMAILLCMLPEPAQPLACTGAILNALHAIDTANEECS